MTKMDEQINGFYSYLQTLAPISLDVWAKSKSLFYIKEYEPQEFFQRHGESVARIGFVINGLFRAYFEDENRMQKGMMFSMPREFVGSYTSYLCKTTSRLNIVAEKKSLVICVDCSNLQKLYAIDTVWNHIGRLATEVIVKRNEERQFELLMMTATERYERFLKTFPDLCEQIPQWQIASYLGITPVALSRIRRQRVRCGVGFTRSSAALKLWEEAP